MSRRVDTFRIPEIDKLLTDHNDKHVDIVCISNTTKDKNKLKKLDNDLNKKIDYVNKIINEVLDELEARGCKVSEYI